MNKLGKYFLLVTGLALVATLAHIPGVTTNVHAKGQSCSVASLKGKYAFRRSGTDNLVGGPNCQGFTDCGPIAEMGVASYDGNGTRGLIRTTRSTAGELRPWGDQPAPNGTYTIDSDCTGSFFDTTGTLRDDVIVVDGGKRFFVLSQDPGTTVTEEGIRLEEEDD